MTLWSNDIERDAWIETNCRKCYQVDEAKKRVLGQGDGCPLLARAATGRKPAQWTKRRNAAMGYTYKCDWYRRVPDVNRRGTAVVVQEGLFDVEPEEIYYVPVEGWPTKPQEVFKEKKGDHQ